MKIKKLILENFGFMQNEFLEVNRIEIDFSNSKNKICLIIGPNGVGKTSILSMLHPFAQVGNLDVRSGAKLIQKGKKGYKEIIIVDENNEYVIKHFYTPQKDKNHSLKSYIEKNGKELNPNGNVTSFEDIVKSELYIEPDYLKLIRLGDNVTSLIDLTATERKKFMGKVVSDVDEILFQYKNINNKLNQLKEMISHTIDKISRLDIVDKKTTKKEIESLEDKLRILEETYLKENSNLTIYKNNIDNIEDSDSLSDKLISSEKKLSKMEKILSKKDELESLDVSFYLKKIEELEKKIIVLSNEKASNLILIENSLKMLNTFQEQFHSLGIQYQKEGEKDKELLRMDDNLKRLRLKVREYENNIGNYSPNYTKKEIEDFIVFLKNIMIILSRTYDFGKKPVSKVVNLMRKNRNVMNYINSHLIEIDERESNNDSVFLAAIISRFGLTPGKEVIFSCKEECKAKELYNQLSSMISNSMVKDKTEDSSFYKDMELVSQNIESVLSKFSDYKDLICRFPNELKSKFSLESIYKKMENLEPVIEDSEMNQLLSMITEYDNYLNALRNYQIEEETLEKFSSLSNSSYIKEQLDTTKSSIEEIKGKISSYKKRNLYIDEDLKEYGNTLEVYHDIKDSLEQHDELKKIHDEYAKKYSVIKDMREKIYQSEISIIKIKTEMDNLKSIIETKRSNLVLFKSLNKDLAVMNYVFNDMTFLKNALSSKEGIPLHKIGIRLGNIVSIANNLLDIVYKGRIYLDNFNISPTEFSIPFYNNGILLEDIKDYASQGETSFLTLALSFALASQMISKYNIMLLDEIDGMLDESNREKFIEILEYQIDSINAEQSFLITHNNMFSSYPVDILDLSRIVKTEKNTIKEFPLANFINIKAS